MNESSKIRIPALTTAGQISNLHLIIRGDFAVLDYNGKDCPHIIADANGNCITCGEVLENPLTTLENFQQQIEATFGKVFIVKSINAGLEADIPAICTLAEEALAETKIAEKENQDPLEPSRPRIQIVGDMLMRIPFQTIFNDVALPYFHKARKLGYRGNFVRWIQFVRDAEDPIETPESK